MQLHLGATIDKTRNQRTARFTVPASALIAMPDDMPPALLVERFDIRTGPNDKAEIYRSLILRGASGPRMLRMGDAVLAILRDVARGGQ